MWGAPWGANYCRFGLEKNCSLSVKMRLQQELVFTAEDRRELVVQFTVGSRAKLKQQ